ncbi:MAG: hypothetical protein EA405_06180 [Rhodospirillales bacterium]|nr:MAG: hypothetical protein EA405_06180 [Rhodospirillales bacterium]
MADLEPVIRIARSRVDEQRRVLAALLRQADALAAQRRRIEADIAAEAALLIAEEPGTDVDIRPEPGVVAHFGPFVARAEAERLRVRADLDTLESEIATAREALADAYRARRVLELAADTRRRKVAAEAARREQDALDESGIARHRRRSGRHG